MSRPLSLCQLLSFAFGLSVPYGLWLLGWSGGCLCSFCLLTCRLPFSLSESLRSVVSRAALPSDRCRSRRGSVVPVRSCCLLSSLLSSGPRLLLCSLGRLFSLSLDRRSLCSGDRLRSCRCRVFGLSLRRLSVDWLLDRLLLSSCRRSFGRLRDRLVLPLAWLRDRSRFFDRLSFPRSFDSLRERLLRSLERLFSRRSLDRLRGRLLREERSRCLECARSSRRRVFGSSSLYCCRLSGLPVLV